MVLRHCVPTATTPRLELPRIGAPQKLTIGHNNKGESPSWCLELVEVLDESSNTTTFFAASKWLGNDTPGATSEVTLVGTREDPRQGFAGYKIDFHTSTLRGAGTDANVWFELVGDKGSSKAQQCRAPTDAFERGCMDSFEHRWPWLGGLRRLVVWHDNSSANPAWHLSKVVVTCSKDGQVGGACGFATCMSFLCACVGKQEVSQQCLSVGAQVLCCVMQSQLKHL